MIEHALQEQFNKEILAIVEKHYSGSARSELLDLLGTRIDLDCFSHIYRLKKYYSADPAVIRAMLPDRCINIRPKVLSDMIAAPDADAALDIFRSRTTYGRRLDAEQLRLHGVEFISNAMVYRKALRLMRTSVNPTTVLLSYVTLAEIESKDIITIVESVFYKLPADEIRQLITIDEYNSRT